MKKQVVLVMSLSLCFLLTACGHEHNWQAATCSSSQICTSCGETVGEPLGHDWVEAGCEVSRHCSICGLTSGEPLGHSWSEATCEEPKKCYECSKIQGEALGHDIEMWEVTEKATCTSEGVESGICSVCEKTVEKSIAKVDHVPGDWVVTVQPTPDEDGTRVKKCKVCETQLQEESFEVSAEEMEKLYKKNCKSISYDNLSRNPGDYEGEYVKFSGYVVQVCSEATSSLYYSTYRVATNGRYDNVVYIKVDNYGSGSRILEDDRVTFYGTYDGLYTYETVMGASVTIPSIIVEYID